MVIDYEQMTFLETFKKYLRKKNLIPCWFLSLTAISIFIGGSFLGLLIKTIHNSKEILGTFELSVLKITQFTLLQGFLSTILSLIPALFIARAFFRHPNFQGRTLILKFFALFLSLPSLVMVIGILEIFSKNGPCAYFLWWIGNIKWPGIYGIHGILIGHVIFNIPLATRLFLEALNTTPKDHWRLAHQLGMNTRSIFCILEWPTLRAVLPGIAGLIFMLCITSFTIVLILGGSPATTTLEVAIYQALRFDFNLTRAVMLTIIQITCALFITLFIYQKNMHSLSERTPSLSSQKVNLPSPSKLESTINFLLIILSSALLLAPIAAILINGLFSDLGRLLLENDVQRAACNSLIFSFLSATFSLLLSWPLAIPAPKTDHEKKNRKWKPHISLVTNILLAPPPIVMGIGWFVLAYPTIDMDIFSSVMIICTNTIIATPFVIRILRPAYSATTAYYDHLTLQLGISGYKRFQLILWPILRDAIIKAFLFAAALSFGDLGTAALFSTERTITLPFLLLSRMGSYRTTDAEGLAFLLGFFCLSLMILAERKTKNNDRRKHPS